MLWASLAFVVLLLLIHTGADSERLMEQPLSLFRENYNPAVAFVLFGLLLAIGGLAIHTSFQARRWGETMFFSLVTLLLLVIMVTPSFDSLHTSCVSVALLLVYLYFAVYLAEQPCLLAIHLASPILLLALTQAHSYGMWQKATIVYYLALANARYYHPRAELQRFRREPSQPTCENVFPS